MGYIFLLIIGGAVLIGLFVAFAGGRKRPAGRTEGGRDVTIKEPSAETINPAASSTSSQAAADAAQKHVPPA